MNTRYSTTRIFGFEFSTLNLSEVASEVASVPNSQAQGMQLVVTANVDHVINLRRSPLFRDAYRAASIRTIDGAPLMLYARLRGLRVPHRVTGADLLPIVLGKLQPGTHRIFFVAASSATAEALQTKLRDSGFSEACVTTDVPPFGFEADPAYCDGLIKRIADHGTTHLILGVGAPKSEIFAYRNQHYLGGVKVLCVGAALGFYTGEASRAPKTFQVLGLEWTWRLAMEPKRLWRRYLVGALKFGAAVRDDLKGAWPS